MRHISLAAVVLPALLLAACEGAKGPTSPNPPSAPAAQGLTPALEGQQVASVACAPCHGSDYAGAKIEGGPITPSLKNIKMYTDEAFDRLLQVGVARNGVVVDRMKISVVSTLSADDRSAVRAYLSEHFAEPW